MSKNSKEYMPTFALIAANVAVYAFTSFLSGNIITTSDNVIAAFGQDNYAILLNGEVWRLVTAMFIHADIVHIFGNMLFLLIFGLRAEDMFDIKEYLMIYFVSGLSGGLLTLAFWPNVLSVGASGAIFGVSRSDHNIRQTLDRAVDNDRADVRFLPVRHQHWT